MNYLISNITNFRQKLRLGRMKNQVGLLNSILQHQLVVSQIDPCEASSYFSLPKKLRNPIKGCYNIKNKENKCFRWCLVSYLNAVNKNPAKIKTLIKNLQNNLILAT